MASDDRHAPDSVDILETLRDSPHRYGFFRAIRELECHFRDHPRVGKALRVADDPIRLGQMPSMSFAHSTIASFSHDPAINKWRLLTYFFGVFGPHGPLPLHLTEYVYDRIHNARDPTLARFADCFHHRLASLFYRAWADSEPTAQFDRPEDDRFGDYVGSLFGIGGEASRDRDAMPDLAKMHYSGHLACQTRHAEGLASILNDFFQVPIKLEQFVGHWMALPDDCKLHLGATPRTGTLGVSASIGAFVWDYQQKFRIIVGPVTLPEYLRMLPGGVSLRRLAAIVHNYAGQVLSWDVRLVLNKDEVPKTTLGQFGQLGWTSWLGSETRSENAADLVLDPS